MEKKKSLMVLLNERHEIAQSLSEAENPVELLESIDKEIQVKTAGIAIYLETLDSIIDSLDITLKKLQARKKMFQNRKERLREYTYRAMASHNLPKVECPECTITITKNQPRVEIEDIRMIPPEFFKEPACPFF